MVHKILLIILSTILGFFTLILANVTILNNLKPDDANYQSGRPSIGQKKGWFMHKIKRKPRDSLFI